MKDGYLNRWNYYSEDGKPDASKDVYFLSYEGIQGYINASYQNQGLYQYIANKKAANDAMDIQIKINTLANSNSERKMKKYWWLFLIAGWIAGIFTDLAKDYIKQKIQPSSTLTERKNLNKSATNNENATNTTK